MKMFTTSENEMTRGVPWHRHSCPTMSGNVIAGERRRSSKQGRKPKWKQGLRKHKHQYNFAKDNSPLQF